MTEHDTDPSVEQKIEQLYRSLSTEQPPAALDRQILKAAHRAVEDRAVIRAASRTIWLRSLAYAAVVIVGVSVIIEVSMQPEVMPNEPEVLIEQATAPSNKEMMSEFRSLAPKPSPDRRSDAEESSRNQMQRANKTEVKAGQKVPPVASKPRPDQVPAAAAAERQRYKMAAPDTEAVMQDEVRMDAALVKPWRDSPQAWLQQCQRLLAENKTDQLVIELAEFRRRYADYPIPQDLSDWLKKASVSPINP